MDYKKARHDMVDHQLIARGILDERLLAVMEKIPRHEFVAKEFKDEAYGDFPLHIGVGQTISQPYMVALMTECMELTGEEKVLEIGTGSGYQAAILAELSKEVISIERHKELAERAEKLLKKLKYNNIKIIVGDGTEGYKPEAPYDAIMVTAGARNLPGPLIAQLKDEGVLVIPVGGDHGQTLLKIQKKGTKLTVEEVTECVFVPLIGKYS